MDNNKSFTIVAVVGLIMFFGMFWVLSITNAWINTPTEYVFKIEMDNNTQRVLENLNGTITINNYYGEIAETKYICKETIRIEDSNSYLISEYSEQIYDCNITKVR